MTPETNEAAAWSSDELDRIGTAEELQLASRRADGTLRPFVTMWVVRVRDDLYVRSACGPDNGWYRRAKQSGAGRIGLAVCRPTSPSAKHHRVSEPRSTPRITPSTTATGRGLSALSSATTPTPSPSASFPKPAAASHRTDRHVAQRPDRIHRPPRHDTPRRLQHRWRRLTR
jgi:hypothetical protein